MDFLIIDNNEKYREVGADVLARKFDVTIAESGYDALQILNNYKVMTVIASSEMPMLGILEFIEKMVEQETFPKWLILCGTNSPIPSLVEHRIISLVDDQCELIFKPTTVDAYFEIAKLYGLDKRHG